MPTERPIPPAEYKTIAENVPIVSVDLLVHHNSGILLGKRTKEPARGEWFVPGGTVLKGEHLIEAAHRVASDELGIDVLVDEKLGTYEHVYQQAELEDVSTKHYLATAFVVTPTETEFTTDDQHEELQSFSAPFPDLHDYVQRYIHDLRRAGYEY